MRGWWRRPTAGQAALVISVLALIVAIGGTALGGGSRVPGRNGVKASDIARGAVKSKQLKNGGFRSVDAPNLAFTAISLRNGWQAKPGNPPGVAKDVLGVVHLKGAISGPDGTNPYVLPERFAPIAKLSLVVQAKGGTASLEIDVDGTATVLTNDGSVNEFLSLDGVSYPAAEPDS